MLNGSSEREAQRQRQIADALAKRERDGVVRPRDAARQRDVEVVARLAMTPIRILPPATRAAMLLRLGPCTPYAKVSPAERAVRGREIEEIVGEALPEQMHTLLDASFRKVAGRLALGTYDNGNEQALWTVRDGADRAITVWIYRKRSLLCARVRGPRWRKRRTLPPKWPLFVAELLLSASGKVTRCRACGSWFGKAHARQNHCDTRCADRARGRRHRARQNASR